MSGRLEFYALNRASVDAVVGGANTDVVRQVRAAEARLFAGDPGGHWRAALSDLVTGERGRALAGRADRQPASPPTADEALAMVAIVRCFGRRVGDLTWPPAAEARLRALLDPGYAPRQFAEPPLAPWLLARPLAGLAGDGRPGWGGLHLDEIKRLLGGRDAPASPPPDADHGQWAYELVALLGEVRDWDSDLVTLRL